MLLSTVLTIALASFTFLLGFGLNTSLTID
jgi:hypothetical protein